MVIYNIVQATGSLLGLGVYGRTPPSANPSAQPTASQTSDLAAPQDNGGVRMDFSPQALAALDQADARPATQPPATAIAAASMAQAAPTGTRPAGAAMVTDRTTPAEIASDAPTRRIDVVEDASQEQRMRDWAIGMLQREKLTNITLAAPKPAQLASASPLARESANLDSAPAPRTLTRA